MAIETQLLATAESNTDMRSIIRKNFESGRTDIQTSFYISRFVDCCLRKSLESQLLTIRWTPGFDEGSNQQIIETDNEISCKLRSTYFGTVSRFVHRGRMRLGSPSEQWLVIWQFHVCCLTRRGTQMGRFAVL